MYLPTAHQSLYAIVPVVSHHAVVLQGAHFCATTGAPERLQQPKRTSLGELYADGRAPQPAPTIVARIVNSVRHKTTASGGVSDAAAALLVSVGERGSVVRCGAHRDGWSQGYHSRGGE